MPAVKKAKNSTAGVTKKTTKKAVKELRTAALEDEDEDDDDDEEDGAGKIYCANCRYCVLLRRAAVNDRGHYHLRVKCSKEMWKKKLGEEKLYKYFTVARRTVNKCDLYAEMGDLKSFLRVLRKSLPVRDEIYTVKK